jgi:hypothetical protein
MPQGKFAGEVSCLRRASASVLRENFGEINHACGMKKSDATISNPLAEKVRNSGCQGERYSFC